MEYHVACSCGNVLPVSEGMAGSSTACRCGRTVPVPSLGELRGEAITPAAHSTFPDSRFTDEPAEAYPSQAFTAAASPHSSFDLRDQGISLTLTVGEALTAVATVLLIPLLGLVLAALLAQRAAPERGPFWPERAARGLPPPPPPPPVR
jgi:hypothetical protein